MYERFEKFRKTRKNCGNGPRWREAERVEVSVLYHGATPEEVDQAIIRRLNTRDPVLDILVQAPMGTQALRAYCEDLKQRLLGLPA